MLGYGASSKPQPHEWSLDEQADIIEQVWAQIGVERTLLVAHDVGSTVALELLARKLPVIEAVVLLNGGLYPQLHRPTDGQQMLLGPDGEALAAVINQELFQASVAATFGSTGSRDARPARKRVAGAEPAPTAICCWRLCCTTSTSAG